MVLISLNPATGVILKKYKEWTPEQILRQITESAHSFTTWRKTDFSERSLLLKNTALLLRKNKKRYAYLMTKEMGKPVSQAHAEIEKCAWACEYYAEHGKRFLENEIIHTGPHLTYVSFPPLGPVLAVMPWNFPFWQVFRCTAPALMAGNVVLLKHSSNVPQCSLALEEIFKEAGFPKNVFRSLLIGPTVVKNVIADTRIAAVTITGSTSTGRSIAKTAAAHLKKVVLELGGNDSFIVLDDEHLPHVVEQAIIARMLNTGQSCIAAKRFIIISDVYNEFASRFTAKVNQLIVGDPSSKSTDVGPLARKDILAHLETQVNRSVQKGAIVLTGGTRMRNHPGYYYTPTVLSEVTQAMPVFREETFGPVASLIRVHNEKEAIKVANDTSYGLGASIWTRNWRQGQHLAQEIQAGAVFVNEIVKSDPRLPFGGIKESGYGRELSSYGMKEFVNIQTVWINKPERR
jgi:succinate-semialdehyde dehydrogenase/glutarate-semialdehyde dehydrogenase